MSTKTRTSWSPLLFRPNLPKDWHVQEQLDSPNNSYITFVRWGKIHHKAEPTKIYAVFCEFFPGDHNFLYTVRGGKYAKPDESLKYFNELKDAEAYLIYVMESTDRWLEEINSEKHIKAEEDRIKRLVAEQEKREAQMREALSL